ncbi:MAG: hypothetical protein JW716_01160 [Candidatus Aenigmarchaeota archaeon]|nr:hypothetical protein [Candidatus Aenigmarchaeota archaeon]
MVDFLTQIGLILQNSVMNFWDSFVTWFPGLVAALIVLILGWVIGSLIGGAVTRVLHRAKLDYWIKTRNLKGALYGKELSSVLGSLVKWYIIVVFLGEAALLVKLTALSAVVTAIVLYLPVLIGAALVILIGMLIGEYVKNEALDTKMGYKELVGGVGKWLIIYFAIVIGLDTAGFEVSILVDAFRIGFAALAIVVAIVVGIGFGLAFKDDIEKYAQDFKKDINKTRKKK